MKITITGLAGTGKGTLSKKLAKQFNLEVFSIGDIFRKYAEKEGKELSQFEKEHLNNNFELDKKIDLHQTGVGEKKDNFILESRLGFYFIKDSFKINIICEDDVRFQRISLRESKDISLVKEETKNREESIDFRYKKIYGKTYKELISVTDFDIVINATNIGIEEVYQLALDKINEKLK